MNRAGQSVGSWKSTGGLYHGHDRTAPAAARLVNLHERFVLCFGRRESREHSFGYLRGLLLAHLFVTQTRRDLNRKVPDLTVDMAMRLLQAALPRPQLTLEEAGELIDYHRDRNKQATESHRKTWLTKHPTTVP